MYYDIKEEEMKQCGTKSNVINDFEASLGFLGQNKMTTKEYICAILKWLHKLPKTYFSIRGNCVEGHRWQYF